MNFPILNSETGKNTATIVLLFFISLPALIAGQDSDAQADPQSSQEELQSIGRCAISDEWKLRWNITKMSLDWVSTSSKDAATVSFMLGSFLRSDGYFETHPNGNISGEGNVGYYLRIGGGTHLKIPVPIGAVATINEGGVRAFSIEGKADAEQCVIQLEPFEAKGKPLQLAIQPGNGRTEWPLFPPMVWLNFTPEWIGDAIFGRAEGQVGAFKVEFEAEMAVCDRLWLEFERRHKLAKELLEEAKEESDEIDRWAEEEFRHWLLGAGVDVGLSEAVGIGGKGLLYLLEKVSEAALLSTVMVASSAVTLIIKMHEAISIMDQLERMEQERKKMMDVAMKLVEESVDRKLEREKMGCRPRRRPSWAADLTPEKVDEMQAMLQEGELPESEYYAATRSFELARIEVEQSTPPNLESAVAEMRKGMSLFSEGTEKLVQYFRYREQLNERIRDLLSDESQPVG